MEIAFQSLMMLQEMVILLIVHKLCGRLIIGVHVQSNFAGDGKRRWTSLVGKESSHESFYKVSRGLIWSFLKWVNKF
uniref:Uncharacterized protein n=1 Tax=Salix viminalis TaxID=40686 RepID=A0A6N2K5S7_SALVM